MPLVRRRGPAAAWLLAVFAGCAPARRPAPAPAPASAPPPAAAPARAAPATAAPNAAPAAAGAPAPAHAHEHAHHDVAAAAPVTVPPGALYTAADVRFMQHMIAHHAQAVAMSRLAAERAANPRLLRLARKIDQSQAGEIALMQQWLRANGQAAPDTSSWRAMPMAGMLTPAQMAALAAARGPAFDRLFLAGMIRHHEGALQMVADLRASPRAAQDVDVAVLAGDVETTQAAEIALMRQLLADR